MDDSDESETQTQETTPGPTTPELPEGKTLRAYQHYKPRIQCMDCGREIAVRVFDGMPPRGHDDNIVYQEIIILGVKKCGCGVQVAQVIEMPKPRLIV